MTARATGSFEVQMTWQPPHDTAEGATLSRASATKQFSGDLVGTSTLEMLSAMTSVQGSASYVALERVTGNLQGREGSFVLHHTGIMTRGTPSLTVAVVPDSGTGALAGLAGRMSIDIVEGHHLWSLDYTLG